MRISYLETRTNEYFYPSLREQRSRSINPHNDSPLLYLKCWGSDYPYLRKIEQQKRWLPALVTPGAGFDSKL